MGNEYTPGDDMAVDADGIALNNNKSLSHKSKSNMDKIEKKYNFPRIGQGAIMYGRGENAHWLCTLADSTRVADDFGKFRLCYQKAHKAMFGMHGSFVVARNDLEQAVTFDHGLAGSITEDSYFILVASDKFGVRINWIDALMYEQSPFSAVDFAKQRSRWFCGIFLCVIADSSEIGLKWRLGMAYLNMLWMISFVSALVMLAISPFFAYFGFPYVLWISRFAVVWFYMLGFFLTYDAWVDSEAPLTSGNDFKAINNGHCSSHSVNKASLSSANNCNNIQDGSSPSSGGQSQSQKSQSTPNFAGGVAPTVANLASGSGTTLSMHNRVPLNYNYQSEAEAKSVSNTDMVQVSTGDHSARNNNSLALNNQIHSAYSNSSYSPLNPRNAGGGFFRYTFLACLQVVGIPYFFLLEGAGVIHGIWQVLIGKPTGFFIVQKEAAGFTKKFGLCGPKRAAANNNNIDLSLSSPMKETGSGDNDVNGNMIISPGSSVNSADILKSMIVESKGNTPPKPMQTRSGKAKLNKSNAKAKNKAARAAERVAAQYVA